MSFRFMRIILMYDLPMITASDRRIYNKFHRSLIREGFYMLQFSVYVKLAINRTVCEQIRLRIRKFKPEKGFISLLEVTEKQFASMEFISGTHTSDVLSTTDRITFFDD